MVSGVLPTSSLFHDLAGVSAPEAMLGTGLAAPVLGGALPAGGGVIIAAAAATGPRLGTLAGGAASATGSGASAPAEAATIGQSSPYSSNITMRHKALS